MEDTKCLLSSLLFLVALLGLVSGQTIVDAVFNGSAILEVFPNPDPPPQSTAQWLINTDTVLALVTPPNPPQYSALCRGRCELYNNGTLRLDHLNYTDQMEYRVIISNLGADYNYANTYTVHVYSMITVAPNLTINSTTPGELTGGTYLSLYCDAGSQNVSTYTFYRNGKNATSDPNVIWDKDSLHFQPITGVNSGNYTCTIQNPFSSKTSDPLKLLVIEPVSDVTLTSNASELVWPGLDTVSLHCSARGTDVSYSWSLEGAPLPADPRYHLSENNSTLTIRPVSDKDNGPFTCTAKNTISNGTSEGLNLTLASPVSSVILTKNTTELLWVGQNSGILHCSALGSAVHFSWSLDGKPLPSDSRYKTAEVSSPPSSRLTINPVSKIDAGDFTCMAMNRLNNATSNNATLDLAWLPEGPILCTAEQINQQIQLGCAWKDGRPPANVSLTFRNETSEGLNTVTWPVALGNAAGTQLNCHGNLLGRTSECLLKLDLPQAPGHNNNSETNVDTGKSLELKVTLVENGLPAQFTWIYPKHSRFQSNRTRMPTEQSTNFTSTLTISEVREQDSGKYECVATNIIGSQHFIFSVNVTKAAVPPSSSGLDGGAIAGIVIGVLAGITLIGILVFFLVKREKRKGQNKGLSQPEVPINSGNAEYAVVNKKRNQNGGVAETTMTNPGPPEEEDIKYAELNFSKQPSAKTPIPAPEETEYSQVKISKR